MHIITGRILVKDARPPTYTSSLHTARFSRDGQDATLAHTLPITRPQPSP